MQIKFLIFVYTITNGHVNASNTTIVSKHQIFNKTVMSFIFTNRTYNPIEVIVKNQMCSYLSTYIENMYEKCKFSIPSFW